MSEHDDGKLWENLNTLKALFHCKVYMTFEAILLKSFCSICQFFQVTKCSAVSYGAQKQMVEQLTTRTTTAVYVEGFLSEKFIFIVIYKLML